MPVSPHLSNEPGSAGTHCYPGGRNEGTKTTIQMKRRTVNKGPSPAEKAAGTTAMKGFIRATDRADALQREIAALTEAGIAAQDISVGESPSAAMEDMDVGGVLTMRSLACCGGLRGAAELLVAAAGRGVTIRTLDEGVDTSEAPADWASAARLFQRLEWSRRSELSRAALRGAKAVGGRGAGRPKPERLKRGLREALAEYYSTGRSVREICSPRSFDPSVLYRCIDQNGLPRRREVADDPSRHPFAGGKSLRVRMGDEWVKVAPPVKRETVEERENGNDLRN